MQHFTQNVAFFMIMPEIYWIIQNLLDYIKIIIFIRNLLDYIKIIIFIRNLLDYSMFLHYIYKRDGIFTLKIPSLFYSGSTK